MTIYHTIPSQSFLDRSAGHALLLAHRAMQRTFVKNCENAASVQRIFLLNLMERMRDTEFGESFGFAKIKSISDFRNALPIATYESFRPFIQKVKSGHHQALLDKRPLMLASTSGTTGEPKHIPVTQECLKSHQRLWRIWGTYAYQAHFGLFGGKILSLAGMQPSTIADSGLAIGSITSLMAAKMPWLVKQQYVLPAKIMESANGPDKYYGVLCHALSAPNIRHVITANPGTLLQLAQWATQWSDQLLRDIRDGSPALGLSKNPHRALELEHLHKRNEWLPKRWWPNLQLITTWQGGLAHLYHHDMHKWFGSVPQRDPGYIASEGRMTVPMHDGTSAGVSNPESIFLEFVAATSEVRPDSQTLLAHELRVGEKYFVILTTSGGLYRYNISDIVQCNGFLGQSPIISFLGKGDRFANIAGEKISTDQVTEALRDAQRELNTDLGEVTLAPHYGTPPHYVLFVDRLYGTNQNLGFIVDQKLRQMNIEYASRRDGGRLGPIQIRTLAPGAWKRWRDKHLALRKSSLEQYKHPVLIENADLLKDFEAGG